MPNRSARAVADAGSASAASSRVRTGFREASAADGSSMTSMVSTDATLRPTGILVKTGNPVRGWASVRERLRPAFGQLLCLGRVVVRGEPRVGIPGVLEAGRLPREPERVERVDH